MKASIVKVVAGLGFAVGLFSSAYAWTEAETNSVAKRMAEALFVASNEGHFIDIGDGDEGGEVVAREQFPTFESLFEGVVAPGWDVAAKRAAFLWYLNELTTNPECCLTEMDRQLAISSFWFCREKGDTNALQYAMAVLVATNSIEALGYEASLIFQKYAEPSEQMNSTLESMLEDARCLRGPHARAIIYSNYSRKLGVAYDVGQTNLARNGASVLYRGLRDHKGARPLDNLLLKIFPNYGASSNRLSVALRALSDDLQDERTNEYFSPITNQLLSTGQPLPVVEGL